MEEIVSGRQAADAIVRQVERMAAQRAVLMVSGRHDRRNRASPRHNGSARVRTLDAMLSRTPRAAMIAAARRAP
jgi:maleylacetate reductase